jgi:hypothetical protein
MVRAMMSAAEQDEIRQIGLTAVQPVPDMMRLKPAGVETSWMCASTVAQHERLELPIGYDAVRPA